MKTLPFAAITALALAGSATAYAESEGNNLAAVEQPFRARPIYSAPLLSLTNSEAYPISGGQRVRIESNVLTVEGGSEAYPVFNGLAAQNLESRR